jgi:hypothetical protein
MNQLLVAAFVAATSIAASGCAQLTHFNKGGALGGAATRSVDMKQRMAISTVRNGHTIVCAEPSPDALSSVGAQISGGIFAAKPEIEAKLAAALNESAAFTGLRTPTIQLLRDAMFRLCEGYMAGALSEGEYAMQMRRYQRYMVALSSIEHLTGTLRAPTVLLTAEGKAETGESIRALQKQLTDAGALKAATTKERSDLAAAQAKDADARKAMADGSDEANALDAAIATRKVQIDSADAQIAQSDATENALKEAMRQQRGYMVEGKSIASVSAEGLPTQRSDAHVQAVAGAVRDITLSILSTDDIGALCFAQPSIKDGSMMGKACDAHFAQKVAAQAAQVQLAKGRAEMSAAVLADTRIDAEAKLRLLAILDYEPEVAISIGAQTDGSSTTQGSGGGQTTAPVVVPPPAASRTPAKRGEREQPVIPPTVTRSLRDGLPGLGNSISIQRQTESQM